MKTFVVTGANRGIGLALTQEILRFGHEVVAACRNPDGARDLWELEHQHPGKVRLAALDVNSEKSIVTFAENLTQQKIDVLINNAGIVQGYNDTLTEVKAVDLEQCFKTNTIGPILLTQTLLPLLQKSTKPIIAHISSNLASLGEFTAGGIYAYRISKVALNMFMRCMAAEKRDFISVCLHPGWVQTAMGGTKAPVTVEASAKGLYEVMARLRHEDNGRFIDYQGKDVSW